MLSHAQKRALRARQGPDEEAGPPPRLCEARTWSVGKKVYRREISDRDRGRNEWSDRAGRTNVMQKRCEGMRWNRAGGRDRLVVEKEETRFGRRQWASLSSPRCRIAYGLAGLSLVYIARSWLGITAGVLLILCVLGGFSMRCFSILGTILSSLLSFVCHCRAHNCVLRVFQPHLASPIASPRPSATDTVPSRHR